MPFTKLKLTTFGTTLETKWKQGKGVHFTRIALGDGLLGNGSMINRTNLVSERHSILIDSVTAADDAKQAVVVGTLDNGDFEEGFFYRELALMATDPDTGREGTYLYDNAGQECEFLDTKESGTLIYERLKLLIRSEQIDTITFVSSGNPLTVTQEDLEDRIATHNADLAAHSKQRHVIAVRVRGPGKPDYGLGGGGDQTAVTVALETSEYSGGAEISVLVSGVEYDADNMSANGDNAPDGTLILTKMED